MSLLDYESAKDLIKAAEGDFSGRKPESLVALAEEALGVTFPPSYRRFLLEFGCGNCHGVEVYGIIDEDFANGSIPDGMWLTLEQREDMGFHEAYVIVGELGDGSYYALDTRIVDEDLENPVVLLAEDGELMETIASSFGSYLLYELESAA